MSSKPFSLEGSFVPEEPLHAEGAAFVEQVSEFLDGQPRDPVSVENALSGWGEVLEKIGSELYRIGSMLLGEGEETVGLIEQVVSTVDLAACHDQAEARHDARMLLSAKAIAALADRNSASLAAPSLDSDDSGPVSCIEDDDLSAAGVTPEELEHMISGPDRHRLREWLEGLSVSLRVIFVLRAIAGLSSPEVAGLLAEYGGASAQDWTPDAVRSGFRQALCSLASQLIHATR
jgi:hypothetical protein